MAEFITQGIVKYRKDLRPAVEGDKVVIIDVRDLNRDGYALGDIFTVFERWSGGVDTDCGITLLDEEYAVLVEVAESQPDIHALIANLGRRLHEVETHNAQQAYEINELYRTVARLEAQL